MPRADRWIGFEGYKDTGRKLNGWLIDMVQWIVVREDLLLFKLTGFRYSKAIHYCNELVLVIALELNVFFWYKVEDLTGKKRFKFVSDYLLLDLCLESTSLLEKVKGRSIMP